MSGSASLDLERLLLGHTLAIAPMPTLARVYVALCETAPTEAAGGAELAGGGYARSAATFALLATPANAAANASVVDFAPATADWRPISHFELWTAATGGTRLYWGRLLDPTDGAPIEIDVLSGSAVRFSPGSLIVQAADSSAGSVGDSLVWAPGGSIPRTLTERTTDDGYSVLECGAKGDWSWDTMTGTNDQAAIQALLDNPPVGRRITFPPGRQFYVGTGLVLAANANLFLSGADFSGIAYPPKTSGLVCDANCDCLTINGPQGAVIENLTFSSRATVQPTVGAGIKALGGRRITLHRTLCYNNYEAYRFQGVDGVGGLGAYMIEPYAAKVVRAYIVQHTWAELYISGGGRIGNAPDWTIPQAHISIEGGSTTNGAAGPNSFSAVGVQFQASAGPVNFMQFVNRTPGAIPIGIESIGIHDAVMESGSPAMSNVFYADSTWSYITRFSITGMYINAPGSAFWSFPPTFTLIAGAISANKLLNSDTFTLTPAGPVSLQMSSQQLDSDINISPGGSTSVVSMVGMEIIGNVTLGGVWRGLSLVGGSVSGTITSTATGNVNILVPNQVNSVTSDLTIGGNAVASAVDLRLNAAAGQVRAIHGQSAGVDRFTFGLTAGDNVSLSTYNTSGTIIGTALAVSTTTGLPSLPMGAVLPLTGAPATATATGTAGEVRIDTGFIYVCTATNTWKRVAVATW